MSLRLIAVFFFIFLALLLCVRYFDGRLRVVFFDVGQGDAAYIRTPQGDDVVIDAGRDDTVVHALGRAMPFFDSRVEALILTHPDTDHITGAVRLLERFQVRRVFLFERSSDSPVWRAFLAALAQEHATVLYPRAGDAVSFGTTRLLFLSPLTTQDQAVLSDNDISLVTQLRFGENRILFTGDISADQERVVARHYGESLASDILKVSHHGSRYSSDTLFLENVRPQYGIISAGKDNPYGHPNRFTLERLRKQGITIFSTLDQGNISFVCDGRDCFSVSSYCQQIILFPFCPK